MQKMTDQQILKAAFRFLSLIANGHKYNIVIQQQKSDHYRPMIKGAMIGMKGTNYELLKQRQMESKHRSQSKIKKSQTMQEKIESNKKAFRRQQLQSSFWLKRQALLRQYAQEPQECAESNEGASESQFNGKWQTEILPQEEGLRQQAYYLLKLIKFQGMDFNEAIINLKNKKQISDRKARKLKGAVLGFDGENFRQRMRKQFSQGEMKMFFVEKQGHQKRNSEQCNNEEEKELPKNIDQMKKQLYLLEEQKKKKLIQLSKLDQKIEEKQAQEQKRAESIEQLKLEEKILNRQCDDLHERKANNEKEIFNQAQHLKKIEGQITLQSVQLRVKKTLVDLLQYQLIQKKKQADQLNKQLNDLKASLNVIRNLQNMSPDFNEEVLRIRNQREKFEGKGNGA